MSESWHTKKSVQDRLLAFHQAKASFQQNAATRARHEQDMREIRGALKEAGTALRFEFTGSSYEGLKVGSTDMEFDLMVVLSGGNHLKDEVVRSGWAKLKPVSNPEVFTKTTSNQYLDPKKTASQFHGALQGALNNMSRLGALTTLRMHGPAVQMDVYDNQSKTRLLYSVDMVPAYQLTGNGADVTSGKYYVAKPFKGEPSDGMSWRLSFSIPEKKDLESIDHGNKCARQCIRIIKVIRDVEPGLKPIVSYWLKTALLNLKREKPLLDWSQTKLSERLFDIMGYLATSLQSGKLKHHYLPKVNIIDSVSAIQRENIYSRLYELIRSEVEFNRALDRAQR